MAGRGVPGRSERKLLSVYSKRAEISHKPAVSSFYDKLFTVQEIMDLESL